MSKFIRYIEHGTEFRIGRGAKSNWCLLDESSHDDVWVHLHGYPSAHVIFSPISDIMVNGRSTDYLRDCVSCAGAICYNRSINKLPKNIKNISVCYSLCKHLKKGKSVGEVILNNNVDVIKLRISDIDIIDYDYSS